MRSVTKLNERWFYLPFDLPSGRPPRFRDKYWQEVKLPHVPDEGFSERYWYCKSLRIERMPGERAYVHIDTPAANCRLFVGGKEIEKLRSGMVHTIELTKYHKLNRPLQLAFRFKGSSNKKIGGFPRGISVIVVPRSHFSFEAKGRWGINIQTELQENAAAKIKASAAVLLPEEGQKITFAIGGPNISVPVKVPAAEFAIPRPRFWTPMDPFLYTLRAILLGRDRTHLDTVEVSFGVREIKITPEGMNWNGVPVPTRGVLRETPEPGAALTAEKELALLSELGADTLLLSGVPEADEFYEHCDTVGLRLFQSVASLNTYKNRKDGLDAAKKLIFRLYNHPSVAGYVVDISDDNKNESNSNGMSVNESTARALCELIRHADPARPIVLTGCEIESLHEFSDLPADAVAVCVRKKADLEHLDNLHAKRPDLALMLHQDKIELDADLAQAMRERPWLIALATQRLYAAEDAKALLNAKNEAEDSYFLLRSLWTPSIIDERKETQDLPKATLAPKPFVHVCGFNSNKPERITVYSNAPKVTLKVDGKEFATIEGQGIFSFDGVKLKPGGNQLLASAGDATHARILTV